MVFRGWWVRRTYDEEEGESRPKLKDFFTRLVGIRRI